MQKTTKTLPKSQREANRYIKVHITNPEQLTFSAFSKDFMAYAIKLVGLIGVAQADIQIVRDVYKYPNAIIKTNPKGVRTVKAIIAYMYHDTSATVKSIMTSGQIHKVK